MTQEHVSVVGGGWSVKNVNLKKLPGFIVAVNDSAIHLPKVDAVVTMDRLWVEHRWGHLREMRKPLYARRSALKALSLEGEDWVISFDNENGKSGKFAENAESGGELTLNGNNSGVCALNLAYHLRPTHLWIFGMDMSRGPKREAYWYPPYPWNLAGGTKDGKYLEWGKQLESYVKQFRARNIHVTVVTDHRWSKSVPLITTQAFKEFQRA